MGGSNSKGGGRTANDAPARAAAPGPRAPSNADGAGRRLARSSPPPTTATGRSTKRSEPRAAPNNVAELKQMLKEKELKEREQAMAKQAEDQSMLDKLLKRVNEQAAKLQDVKRALEEKERELEQSEAEKAQLRRALELGAKKLEQASIVEEELDIRGGRMRAARSTFAIRGDANRADGPPAARDEKGINDSAALRWRGVLKQAQKAQAVEAAAQGADGGRHAREQLKRLLHYLKAQMAIEIAAWREAGEGPGAAADAIAARRKMSASFEAELNTLIRAARRRRRGEAPPGLVFAIKGTSLPRSMNVDVATGTAMTTLASGPARKWAIRLPDAAASEQKRATCWAIPTASSSGRRTLARRGGRGGRRASPARTTTRATTTRTRMRTRTRTTRRRRARRAAR